MLPTIQLPTIVIAALFSLKASPFQPALSAEGNFAEMAARLTDATGRSSTVDAGADDPAWSDADSLLIELCDELHDTATVCDELWRKLAASYADDQLLELLVTAGWYRLLSYVINGAGVQHEPWAERFPQAGADASSSRR